MTPLPTPHRIGFDRAQAMTRQFARDLRAGLTQAPARPPCMACAAVGTAILATVVIASLF